MKFMVVKKLLPILLRILLNYPLCQLSLLKHDLTFAKLRDFQTSKSKNFPSGLSFPPQSLCSHRTFPSKVLYFKKICLELQNILCHYIESNIHAYKTVHTLGLESRKNSLNSTGDTSL